MKFLKWVGYSLLFIVFFLFISLWIIHEPLPKGHSPKGADKLALRMMSMINKKAYDSVEYIGWDYLRGFSYNWHKKQNFVEIFWEDYEVQLNTQDLKGRAFKNGELLLG